jgi:hypothetical protein
MYSVTYQSHAPEDGDPVHGLQAEVEEARDHDCQVKDVPAVPEILCSPTRMTFSQEYSNILERQATCRLTFYDLSVFFGSVYFFLPHCKN